jgi:PAS domain S-box-containing protein
MKEDNAPGTSGSEGLFLSAFKASPIGIALEDLEGRPIFVNPALCSLLGFSEAEMRNKHCVEFSPPEDAQKDKALFEQLRAGLINHYQLDKRFLRRDGSLVWGRLSISLLENGASPLVLAIVEDLSEKAAQTEPLRAEAGVDNLGGRLIQAQEEERAKIAQELHAYIDALTALAISLGRGQNPPASLTKAWETIGKAKQQVEEIVSDVWSLLHRLHAAKLDYLGLEAAAASFCKEFSGARNVNINFHGDGIPKDLSKEISLCLYRVLQEALQNATKHSKSRLFEVVLSGQSNEIQLTVRDWGLGFDSAPAMKGSGLGLITMRERLKLVDGELVIDSQPQHGTTIRALVPHKDG